MARRGPGLDCNVLRPTLCAGSQVVEMVKNRLSQEDAQASGWLLDGYPRSAEQAEAIEEAGIRPDVFILINVCCLCIFDAAFPLYYSFTTS